MEISLSNAAWKYSLLTLSILITLVVVALISCGVIVFGIAGSPLGAAVVAVVGFLVMSISFLGCFTALRESYLLSIWYLGITIPSVILETVFMIYFAAMKEPYMQMTSERVKQMWTEELLQPGQMVNIQKQYFCCGLDSPQDYLLDDDDVLPLSCCFNDDCSVTANIYTKGCLDTTVNSFDNQSDNLILTFVATIAFEVLSVFCAYYLGQRVHQQEMRGKQNSISE